MTNKLKTPLIIIVLLAGLGLGLGWLATTDHPAIWPRWNTLEYRLLSWWWEQAGPPQAGLPGRLAGTIRDGNGQPIGGAWVLVSRWNGQTFSDHSQTNGYYHIAAIPAGAYRPVAGAPGYENVVLGSRWQPVTVEAGQVVQLTVTLARQTPRQVSPGQALTLTEPTTLHCDQPLDSRATRRQLHFQHNDQPNQLTFYYTPAEPTGGPYPILLAVYPGPADGWECASLPLAQAGYAVIAIGPAYSLDLEADIDELARLLMFARAGQLPQGDPDRIAILGGSYSGIHVQRLLERGQPVRGAVLLGPPTDLFDMRRRLENNSYVPPYDLDQALIALGLPDRDPRLYWRYSAAYHVRPSWPPLLILHSRSDDVVPYQQSQLLAAHLDLVGAPYEVHFFDGASHYLLAEGDEAATLMIYDQTLDFLKRQLQ